MPPMATRQSKLLLSTLCVTLLCAAPGCSTLSSMFGGGSSDAKESESESESKSTGTPNEAQIADIDQAIQQHLDWLAERPLEPWSNASASVLDLTQDINIVSHRYADEGAKQAFRQERFGKLHNGYTDYFTRVHAEAMAAGDPELAQALTGTQLLLQEDFTWYVEREDLQPRFEEEAAAVAEYRQGVFTERGSYTKLNEMTCVAAPKPLAPAESAQPDLSWHYTKTSEVYVRCHFPTSLEAQTAGGLSFDVIGAAHAWGTSGEGESDRLLNESISLPIETSKFWDQPYFEFAFDLGELTKSMQWGYVRINGTINLTVADQDRGMVEYETLASMRISFN